MGSLRLSLRRSRGQADNALERPNNKAFRAVFRIAAGGRESAEAAVRTMMQTFEQETGLARGGDDGRPSVTAYSVSRRRREIGIRMALGARSRHVLQLVLKEAFVLVVAGSALGFAAAFGASRALAGTAETLARAFALGTDDPRLLVGVPLLLVVIALAACYVPARRSTRISPLSALREE